ncbi:MAG: hypothetical protein JZU52_12660 [Lamprocystis purpurea]|jgi:hypothetical protein|uniref:hypothetical protein n=1 Tax=Lamprocystis purpurea TaxID=61598 RepID=UPI00037E5649|nr:hypothetical protein [Lamprocystis purpurea]MBV5274447.1 hypothetical protein [Lamprocystis purpurea]
MDATPVGAEARTEREWLSGLMLSDQERADCDELDGILIEQTLAGAVLPELLADLPAEPLDHWWWHLGAIRDRSYPADRLPASVRAIYLDRSAA